MHNRFGRGCRFCNFVTMVVVNKYYYNRTFCVPQTVRQPENTAIGCTEYSVMRRLARDTGLVGTAPPPSSCASADCCTTRKLTLATGPKTSTDARNTVSTRQ